MSDNELAVWFMVKPVQQNQVVSEFRNKLVGSISWEINS